MDRFSPEVAEGAHVTFKKDYILIFVILFIHLFCQNCLSLNSSREYKLFPFLIAIMILT